jgi:hypothetical protein
MARRNPITTREAISPLGYLILCRISRVANKASIRAEQVNATSIHQSLSRYFNIKSTHIVRQEVEVLGSLGYIETENTKSYPTFRGTSHKNTSYVLTQKGQSVIDQPNATLKKAASRLSISKTTEPSTP